MKAKYQSELLGAIHETAVGLHKIGVINNQEMREYNDDCLVQEPETEYETGKPSEMAHITALFPDTVLSANH